MCVGITGSMFAEATSLIDSILAKHCLSKVSRVYEDNDSVSWVLSIIKKCELICDEIVQSKSAQATFTNSLLSQYLKVQQ